MNAALRAYAIVADPAAAWRKIEVEPADAAYLLTRYVALLALIPAVCGLIGACVIGVVVPGTGIVRLPTIDGWFGAVFGFVTSCAIVFVLGVVIHFLAPAFGGARDFDKAFKLAVYSYTPVWLTGIFLLLPGLRFLLFLGFYGAYILWLGLPPLAKTPAAKLTSFAIVIVAWACGLTLLAAAAQHALFGGRVV